MQRTESTKMLCGPIRWCNKYRYPPVYQVIANQVKKKANREINYCALSHNNKAIENQSKAAKQQPLPDITALEMNRNRSPESISRL